MFGLSELQGNRLFKVLFFPYYLFVYIFAIGLPILVNIIAYNTGLHHNFNLVIVAIIVLISHEVLAVMFSFFVKWTTIFLTKIFFFIVDIEPSQGLTEEEAEAIAVGGRRALTVITLSRKDQLNERDIEEFIRAMPYLTKIFFGVKIRARLKILNDYALKNNIKPLSVNEWQIVDDFKKVGLKKSFLEDFVGNSNLQFIFLRYLIFLSLFLYLFKSAWI
jgi:hypothetical protein